MENSVCLMLAASLHTAVELDSIISQEDLKDDGVIRDSHITIVYDKTGTISRSSVLSDVKDSLGNEFEVLDEFMKDSHKFKVNDIMYLDTFNNEDSSYIVLRLRESELFKKLKIIHDSLIVKYNIPTDFPEFKPHITLAEVNPGEADKYLSNNVLLRVLNDSKVGFEDLVFSEPGDNEKYDKWNITTHHALDRYFRESNNN